MRATRGNYQSNATGLSTFVRRAWLIRSVAACQVFVGRVLAADDPHSLKCLVSRLTQSIDDPITRAEELMLNALLLELAAKCGSFVHHRVHETHVDCRFVTAEFLTLFWSPEHRGPKRTLEKWAAIFCAEFDRTHRDVAMRRVSETLARAYAEQWELRRLAEATGLAANHLDRAFRAEYQFSPHEYQRRLRLLHAMEAIDSTAAKIESVAYDVGYRSKKNFFQSFRRLTGLTPSAFRNLNARVKSEIMEGIRDSLKPSVQTRQSDFVDRAHVINHRATSM